MTSPAVKLLAGLGGGASFDPLSIDGCALWLDASDTATITASSGAVSQWDDKSINGRDFAQSNVSDRPVTGTRTQNGNNVIDFTGSNHNLQRASFLYGLGACTVFVVCLSDSDPSVHGTIMEECRTSGSNIPEYGIRTTSAGALQYVLVNDAGSVRLALSGDDFGTATAVVITATDSGSAATTRVDGDAEDSAAYTRSNPTTLQAIGLGALLNTNGPRVFDGWIGEVLIYDSVLSSGDQSDVRDYLADKWGITL